MRRQPCRSGFKGQVSGGQQQHRGDRHHTHLSGGCNHLCMSIILIQHGWIKEHDPGRRYLHRGHLIQKPAVTKTNGILTT